MKKLLIKIISAFLLILGVFVADTPLHASPTPVYDGYLSTSYKDLNPLLTDFYQLTMAFGHFKNGKADQMATFYMHWRTPPLGATYTLASGLEGVVDFLRNFRFNAEDLAYLARQKRGGKRLFSEDFITYLSDMKLELQVDAIPEGTVMVGPGPVLRVTGPLIQCQLVESTLLNILNSSSIVSTRAARLTHLISPDAQLVEFSLRRAPGLDLTVARATAIGGAIATSNTDAGRKLGITPVGTMAHSWIMGYADDDLNHSQIELKAFRDFLELMPDNSVLLIDTFDARQGIDHAIQASVETNIPLMGIRIDSGDLYELVFAARRKLDIASQEHPDLFKNTKIFLTDGLNEVKIHELQEKSRLAGHGRFPVDVYGVGTELGNPGPFSGGVYKISAISNRSEINPRLKPEVSLASMTRTMKVASVTFDANQSPVANSKASLPGIELDTLRLKKNGQIVADVIFDHRDEGGFQSILNSKRAVRFEGGRMPEPLPDFDAYEPLLKPIFQARTGQVSELVYSVPSQVLEDGRVVTDLTWIAAQAKAQLESLPAEVKMLNTETKIPVFISESVSEHRQQLLLKSFHSLN